MHDCDKEVKQLRKELEIISKQIHELHDQIKVSPDNINLIERKKSLQYQALLYIEKINNLEQKK